MQITVTDEMREAVRGIRETLAYKPFTNWTQHDLDCAKSRLANLVIAAIEREESHSS